MKQFKSHDLVTHLMVQTRTVYLYDAVHTESVENTLLKLDYLARISTKPITLNICSPGGSVDSGIALYDFIKSSKVKINTHCSGLAASMGAILLAAGHKRTITKNSRVMIHQPSGGYIGKSSDIATHAKEIVRVRELLTTLLANDSGQAFKKVYKDIEADTWLSADEAKEYGLVDKVI